MATRLSFYGTRSLIHGSSTVENSATDSEPVPHDLWVWSAGEESPVTVQGPRIGEGELATTHFVIHHAKITDGKVLRRWTVTSIDTDQIMHLLLAMACGIIQPQGENKTEVTARRGRGQVYLATS